MCWELDNPAHRVWHSSYKDGKQQHVNTRLGWPTRP
jgi:hypothetical protein